MTPPPEIWQIVSDIFCLSAYAALAYLVVAGGKYRGVKSTKGKFNGQ